MEQKNKMKVFTTKFSYTMPTEELKKIMPAVAPKFSEIPGCCWKIWLINEDHKEAGGVYLFESAPELEQFLNSSLFASVANNPAFSNLQTNTFDTVEAASVMTGAPLMKMEV
ncbi:MAG TPA: YdhR family protein [Puia sp.]|nr:YdhR family protein [Puia sp.]